MESQGRFAVRGDALGVPHDVVKMRAREPILNVIAGEIAVILAPRGGDLRAAHLWSEQNEICDQLSRMQPEKPGPLKGLEEAKRYKPCRMRGRLLGEDAL